MEWKWKLVPIVGGTIQPDADLQAFIESYRQVVDAKYNTLLCRTAQKLTHPQRTIETALGNLFADIFAENANCEVALVGSGSIRLKEMGPVVTLRDMMQVYPYEDTFARFTITGEQFRRIFAHIMRPENRTGEGECYQVNSGVRAIYDNTSRQLEVLEVNGRPVGHAERYTIGLGGYHIQNSEANLNVSLDALTALGGSKMTATSMHSVIEEYLRGHQNLTRQVEGRLVYR